MDHRSADPRSPEAGELIAALSRELAARYDFSDDGSGNFNPQDAAVPRSEFLVGFVEGRPVACGAFRPLDERAAEIKRMYVVPGQRGRGYSKLVLAELEARAVRMGYAVARLETGTRQPEAIALYERAGYRRIPKYGIYVGNPLSVCFEKDLSPGLSWRRPRAGSPES
jgi:ribosomal protein S18 acetylase RimI-like enzyme